LIFLFSIAQIEKKTKMTFFWSPLSGLNGRISHCGMKRETGSPRTSGRSNTVNSQPVSEGSGDSHSVIVENDESKASKCIMPEKLKIHLPQALWESFSESRRGSFRQMFSNPNSFFYRNRPPGDPQKFGGWSPSELKEFLDRVDYFHNVLKIRDGLWGLFSVPLRGRLGYQCSNQYRKLIIDGTLKDPNYVVDATGKLSFHRKTEQVISPQVIRSLEREAFDFISACCFQNSSEGRPPLKVEPEDVRPPSLVNKPFVKVERSKKIHRKMHTSGILTPIELEVHQMVDKKRRTEIRRAAINRSNWLRDSKLKTHDLANRRARERKQSKRRTRENNDDISDGACGSEDEVTAVRYAKDPLTKDPMIRPMIDLVTGLVMDEDSWARVLHGDCRPPCFIYEEFGTPVYLTKKLFRQHRLSLIGPSF
jgi:hypothetical protein